MSSSTPSTASFFDYYTAPIRDLYFLNQIGATDSASAGTALSTGYKTDDGNLAWLPGDPANGSLTTITQQLRADNGFSIGVVSTVPFNHATPAAFVSHNVSRNNYQAIAEEILWTFQPEVVIGAGYNSSYVNGLNFTTLPSDYVFVQRQTGVNGGDALATAAATVDVNAGEKLFGLFGAADGNFDYHVVADTPGNPAITQGNLENPSLPNAVTSALTVLGNDPDGFFVMFEQGDIDWANHANDFENMIGGVWDLDQAVRAAETYVDRTGDTITWDNTLIIVTSDHSNSYLKNQVVLGTGDLPTQLPAAPNSSPYGSTWVYPDGDVTYGSGGHINELTTVSARGAGSEIFQNYAGSWYPGTRIVDNTQIHSVMQQAVAAGVTHIMLFIGDGMNIAHETAGSRYLYGSDRALAWHDWDSLSNGWAGYSSTWDTTTYNRYASLNGFAPYSQSTFDPLVGYNPSLGGAVPSEIDSRSVPVPTLAGTTANDILLGTANNDIIAGDAGNDYLWGAGGQNILLGGAGDDQINGDSNGDLLNGGDGNNTLYGCGGDDMFLALGGDDLAYGASGNDIFNLGNGNNSIDAGDGENWIITGTGNDIIHAGTGNDTILAGNGNNTVLAGTGFNRITTGSGNDEIWSGTGGSNITAGAGNDTIYASGGNNTITAGTGDNVITIGWENKGMDTFVLDAGTGSTTIFGFAETDQIKLGSGLKQADITVSMSGNDTLISKGDDLLATLKWVGVSTVTFA